MGGIPPKREVQAFDRSSRMKVYTDLNEHTFRAPSEDDITSTDKPVASNGENLTLNQKLLSGSLAFLSAAGRP